MASESNRIKVKIPQDILEQIVQIAKDRNKKQAKFGAMTYEGGRKQRASLEAHVIGMVAETAAAIHFGGEIDKRIFENHGDDGRDLNLPKYGVTQVKATTYWTDPWLRAEVEHDKDYLDTYMLAYVDENNYRAAWLVGWLPRSEVIKLPQEKCKSNGPLNYVCKEIGLRDFDPPSPPITPKRELLRSFIKSILDKSSDCKRLYDEVLARMN